MKRFPSISEQLSTTRGNTKWGSKKLTLAQKASNELQHSQQRKHPRPETKSDSNPSSVKAALYGLLRAKAQTQLII